MQVSNKYHTNIALRIMHIKNHMSCKYDIPNLASKALLVMQVKHYISDKKGVARHTSKAFLIMQVKHAGESKG